MSALDLDTPQLAETSEALVSWERTLQQLRGTMDSATYREWVDARIRVTRAAGLAVQVQLLQPVISRPHVIRTATGYREDPMAAEANEQWTEAENREAWGK